MAQMKVLLADDHPIVLMGVREIIERDPHTHVTKSAKVINGMGFSVEQGGFGDFDFQPVR